MRSKILLVLVALSLPFSGFAENYHLWQGGLWNLDYGDDVSTYGYFRLVLEEDFVAEDRKILRVEWIEKSFEGDERLYASLLVPELSSFIESGPLSIEMGAVPSVIEFENSRGNKLILNIFEPTRYEIQL